MRVLLLALALTSCVTTSNIKELPTKNSPYTPPVFIDNTPWVSLSKEIKRGANDCAVLASMIGLRQLGVVNSSVPLSQEEWDAVRFDLGTVDVGTSISDFRKFWEAKGFAFFYSPVDSCEDYTDTARSKKDGCIVARYYEDTVNHVAHVEAITDIISGNTCSANTNSWGEKAQVSGFSLKDHKHSKLKRYNGPNIRVIDYVVCKR